MEFTTYIGIDVSKTTLDIAVLQGPEKHFHVQVNNTRKDIMDFYKTLCKQLPAVRQHALFCLEHTGIYCKAFLEVAAEKQLVVWLEDARKIQAYHGLQRAKNDRVDAHRIAEYAYGKRHQVKRWQPPREVIVRLKALLALRGRLVNTRTRLTVALNEEKTRVDPQWTRRHEQLLCPILEDLHQQIAQIEQDIKELIAEDERLKELYGLVSSVQGVGLIVGAATLVVTNEFRAITDPKKMACHCGVAPFRKSSGTSVKGKAKVSHQANKSMKALLNMSARSAVSSPGELREYYLRKVGEGKNKMAVLNAVRNKIIPPTAVGVACVREGRNYEKNYTHALA